MRSEKWKMVKLGDVVEINPKVTLKKGSNAKKIAMEHLKEFTREIQGYTVEEFKSGSKFQNNDTLMARITPCLENGKTAFVNSLNEDEVAFGSTEFFVLRAREGLSDPNFVYYLAISDPVRNTAIQSMSGTSGRQRAQKEALLQYELYLPSLDEQRKIGRTLALFDEKIEINNRIIREMEVLSQTLFNYWFLDFEFPDVEGRPYKSSGGKMVGSELGEIPEGWSIAEIGDFVKLIKESVRPGIETSTKPYVPIDILPMKKMSFYESKPGQEAKSSLIKFKEKDILLGAMRVYFHRVCLAPFDGTTRTTCFVLRPANDIYTYFSLLTLFREEAIDFAESHSRGTTIPYAVWENGLEKYKVVMPPDDVLKSFNKIIEPLIGKTKVIGKEIQSLDALRKLLIPKLLSGEIELSQESEVTIREPV